MFCDPSLLCMTKIEIGLKEIELKVNLSHDVKQRKTHFGTKLEVCVGMKRLLKLHSKPS
jgi:hypothetical protein